MNFLKNIADKISLEGYIYIVLLICLIFLFELYKNKITDKWKYQLLNRSFLILIATFLGGFFIPDSNLKQALFTFSGVYLGFWLNEQIKRLEEKKKLKFFLGLVWQELRYNKVQLKTIKENYSFFMDDEKNLEIMFLKLSGISTQSNFLRSAAYDSFVTSSHISSLSKDSIFNDLATAYTNIRYYQSALNIVLLDFKIKLEIHHYALAQSGKNESVKPMLTDLSKKITENAGKELAIAYRSVYKSIESVDIYLNSLAVKSNEEQKSDCDLIEEDREFIQQILKTSPTEIPKDIFQ